MDKKIALLNKKEILELISKASLSKLDSLIVSKKTGSTNDDAKNTLKESEVNLCAHFAEQQNSGRGRGGKNWTSPFAKNIYFSMGLKSILTLSEIDGLSLAVGVVVAEALQKFINESIKIKWPNDLFIKKQKVGGILIETSSGANNNLEIVIGIGINIFMDEKEAENIDQAWTNLDKYKKTTINRNQIASSLIDGMMELTAIFQRNGFKSYKEKFNSLNALKGKECKIVDGTNQEKIGLVKGINDKGELLLKINNEIIEFRYGEVSIREL
jgi:BirA family biotin operon repressor/biotin-[acetyl-CoA-carboxylase] ligase